MGAPTTTTEPKPPKPSPPKPDRYAWVALANTTAAIFMASLDGSVVIIALPAIFKGINLDPLSPSGVLARLPAASQQTLTGREFFPGKREA